ncbi:peptidoglycan DD-metalloendopeptidase family protein [Cryptosporangium phraense]|uniref:M23 family metallopeptidase n=1 Tax=Cryptosporangium phraense TaxID=2593070 RepID=A0A545AKB0_9ACTN|nr:peptidoglycan DD-metalloendopeptidase family protein [Cryptosporangium phraense]TQS41748.1 M23 family metallopeptidase [Cryptosporangium phraense]
MLFGDVRRAGLCVWAVLVWPALVGFSAGPVGVAVASGRVPAGVAVASGRVPVGVGAGPVPSGGWRAPVGGPLRVVRPFDAPDLPYGAGHRGVDLVAAPGAAVVAAGSGVVLFAGPVGGRGVVSVTHPDGRRTTYGPVRPTVRAGQHVAVGEPVGRLEPGHPGCPVPACLHWGLIGPSGYLDPLTLLSPGRVRLYPVTT